MRPVPCQRLLVGLCATGSASALWNSCLDRSATNNTGKASRTLNSDSGKALVRQLFYCCAVGMALLCSGRATARRRLAPAPAPPLPDPIPTRQTLFSIPFTLPPNSDPASEPVEVRLYGSTDSGGTWAIVGRVDPRQKSFTFRAPHDGEYWFVIRTVDRAGKVRPENARGPELRVIVDTLPPRLELNATRLADGEVNIHWTGVDPLLSAESLKLEFQVAGDSAWHPVSVEFPPPDPGRTSFTGDVRFRPEAGRLRTTSRPCEGRSATRPATRPTPKPRSPTMPSPQAPARPPT